MNIIQIEDGHLVGTSTNERAERLFGRRAAMTETEARTADASTPPRASVFDVAEYILEKTCQNESIGQISTMKLQKLVYYSQAWHLAWDGVALFDADIEAWASGPVVPQLYVVHKGQFRIGPGFFRDALKDPEVQARVAEQVRIEQDQRTARAIRRQNADETGKPADHGFSCPLHHPDSGRESTGTVLAPGLYWSEYNDFIWCSVCDLDIPTHLCVPGFAAESREALTSAIDLHLTAAERQAEALW